MSIKTSLRRAALGFAAIALSVSPALAGGVRIVDPGGQRNYLRIQTAINAAVDGDVLLVGAGTYPGFTLDGKSLSIFAAPAGASVSISGSVTVRNVSGTCVIVGLSVGAALSVANCSGDVRFQDCAFYGYPGGEVWPLINGVGGPACDVVQCARVVLVGCTFRAGDAGQGGVWGLFAQGAYGLGLQASTVAMYDSSVFGGSGPGSYNDDMGPGGDGLRVLTSWLFGSNCSIRGGQGGDDHADIPIMGGGCGGDGIGIGTGSSVHLIDVTAQGGPSGGPWSSCYSSGISNQGGVLDVIPGTGRLFDLSSVNTDRARWNLTIAGVRRDQVFLNRSLVPVFQYDPALSGVCTSVLPPFTPVPPIGTVPGSGNLMAAVIQSRLPGSELARVNFLQGYVISYVGPAVLGSPMHTLSLNWNSGPDCNGNGIQDYAEVIAGITPDFDHNLVPDNCP